MNSGWNVSVKFPALLTVLICVSVMASAAQESSKSGTCEIRIPPRLRDRNVQFRHRLTGPFGGRGATARREDDRLLIATSVERQPAETLKAVIYIPGCQIMTVDIPSLPDSNKTAEFICRDLDTIRFKGRVVVPEHVANRDYFVEVKLLAYWTHKFFGIADGSVTTFSLGRFVPDRSGSFEFRLPDFSNDEVTCLFNRDAALQFTAREERTRNILTTLIPTDNPPGRFDTPIGHVYSSPVVLRSIQIH